MFQYVHLYFQGYFFEEIASNLSIGIDDSQIKNKKFKHLPTKYWAASDIFKPMNEMTNGGCLGPDQWNLIHWLNGKDVLWVHDERTTTQQQN